MSEIRHFPEKRWLDEHAEFDFSAEVPIVR